jgi:ADP-heptose:LPS heptosyltransferase
MFKINFFSRVYFFFRRRFFKSLVALETFLFSNKKRVSHKKTLLILRLDSIGDYILFRNFIQEIRLSEKYKDYKITLCGNIWWQDLSEKLDAETVDSFIWVTYKKMENFGYRFWVYFKIYREKFEVLIYPTYSRDLVCEEIVAHSGAEKRIGYVSDLINLTAEQKENYDKNYTQLISPRHVYEFEFYRNKYFFETLFEEKIALVKPIIKTALVTENKIILCPGAKHKFRRWSSKNFARLSKKLKEDFPDSVFYICGGIEDNKTAQEIIQESGFSFQNASGALSLHDLVELFSSARIIVCNDSGPFHIAVALNKNVVCISNGNNYGRFTPYPAEINNTSLTIYPEELLKIESETERLERYCKEGSTLDINTISVEKVYREMRTKFTFD